MARHTCLISAPANIRTKIIEYDSIRLIFADQFKVTREIVFLSDTVRTFAAGVVKPDIEYLAVLREQLCKLIAEVIIILGCSVIF